MMDASFRPRFYVLRGRRVVRVPTFKIWTRERGQPHPLWQDTFENVEPWIRRDRDRDPNRDPKLVLVSTIFLGVDHGFNRDAPLVFETMVFGGPLHHSQWRYSAYSEAEGGHKAAAKLVGDRLKEGR